MIVGGLGLSVVPFFFGNGQILVEELCESLFLGHFLYTTMPWGLQSLDSVFGAVNKTQEFCASRKEFLNKSRRIPNWTRNSWLFVRDVSGWIPVPCLVSQVSATIYRFMYSLYSDIEIYWVCLQIQQLYILRYWAYIYIYIIQIKKYRSDSCRFMNLCVYRHLVALPNLPRSILIILILDYIHIMHTAYCPTSYIYISIQYRYIFALVPIC